MCNKSSSLRPPKSPSKCNSVAVMPSAKFNSEIYLLNVCTQDLRISPLWLWTREEQQWQPGDHQGLHLGALEGAPPAGTAAWLTARRSATVGTTLTHGSVAVPTVALGTTVAIADWLSSIMSSNNISSCFITLWSSVYWQQVDIFFT